MPGSETRKDDALHEPPKEIEKEKDKDKSSKSKGAAKSAYPTIHLIEC